MIAQLVLVDIICHLVVALYVLVLVQCALHQQPVLHVNQVIVLLMEAVLLSVRLIVKRVLVVLLVQLVVLDIICRQEVAQYAQVYAQLALHQQPVQHA